MTWIGSVSIAKHQAWGGNVHGYRKREEVSCESTM